MADKIPNKGARVWTARGEIFTVSKRTRNAENSAVYLWDGDRPYPATECSLYPPEPGSVIHRRSKQGWTGEVRTCEGGQVSVYLLPDKWWEPKNPPIETWPLADCKPSPISQEEYQRIAGIRQQVREEKQAKSVRVQENSGEQLQIGGEAA